MDGVLAEQMHMLCLLQCKAGLEYQQRDRSTVDYWRYALQKQLHLSCSQQSQVYPELQLRSRVDVSSLECLPPKKASTLLSAILRMS